MERTEGIKIPDLRDQISRDISRAIDSTVNYTGKEYDQNRHNWVQITTDRVIAALMNSLPEPIDVPTKYELPPGQSLPVTLVDPEEDREWNQQQLDMFSKFAMDNGFNRYYFEYVEYLRGLYTAPQSVVQSEHEEHRTETRGTNPNSEGGPQQEDSDESSNQEPSKVR